MRALRSERWCSLQAQQQQSSGLGKQSMEAGADQEARQATGPEANDSRSASPCMFMFITKQACVC